MRIDISIIIVTWNALEHIDQCLDSVFQASKEGLTTEIIVVDNDSSDGTANHVRTKFPTVLVVETGVNGGMAAGNNVGMRSATGDVFLLLNSDAFLEQNALISMAQALKNEAEETVAAVVPALQNLDGSPQRSVRGFPTLWRYATEFLYLRRIAPHSVRFNAFYGGGLDLSKPQRIDWATGACLLVPRGAVDDSGLMDEGYFMYGEEVDWIKRMSQKGRGVVWCPDANVTHVGGGSARSSWGSLYQRQLTNHVRYMLIMHGPKAAQKTRIILTVSLGIRTLLWGMITLLSFNRRASHVRVVSYTRGALNLAKMKIYDLSPVSIPAWSLQQSSVDDR